MTKVKDPLCGMTIEAEHAAAKLDYPSGTVYFCADACRKTYEAQHPLH